MQIPEGIVSENRNLIRNAPVRVDESIDEKELKIVEDITAWMYTNSEWIYAISHGLFMGEGHKVEKANPLKEQ
ncbi:hypothetical protein [Aestuariibaculum suncheonense]|uniref:Uncharacterized protein n=1 Tax=Aestuariibaculum suncheonense TaxID=1028745 RepID=A0A8J6UGI1_9FLAO|nr:hypothetical protein [Aestuariibaculum suncheonense]MBD0835079.1 hypothetical protein [Aestuariibaculum suncheonense]